MTWTTSTITFTGLNLDPLPTSLNGTSVTITRGTVTGGDDALVTASSADTARVYQAGSSFEVVTCRPVIDPPVPPGDVSALVAEVDFRAIRQRTFYETGAADSNFNHPPPGFFFTDATGVGPLANDIGEPRFTTDPPYYPWSTLLWDETDCGVHGGPPVFPSPNGLQDIGALIAIAQAGGNAALWATAAGTTTGHTDDAVFVAQITYQFQWQLSAELRTTPDPEQFRTVSGVPFRLLIPVSGWVPWRDHGASG